jgi:hypothetical protein
MSTLRASIGHITLDFDYMFIAIWLLYAGEFGVELTLVRPVAGEFWLDNGTFYRLRGTSPLLALT